MNKRIDIRVDELVEFDSAGGETWVNTNETRLYESECSGFVANHMITNDELQNALDVIASWFVQTHSNRLLLDIGERRRSMIPVKEMTLDEIEEKLGHKVKIINNEEE